MRRIGFGIVLALGVTVLGGACGGSSKSGFTEPAEGGGGGSSSTTAGTSNNSAGDGDGPMSGGSTPGGTGGRPMGGGAMGGSPTVPMVDPTVREGCPAWCDGVIEAGCDGDTLEDCLFGCRAIVNSPACNSNYAELFECAEGATFECNADGDAVPQGCEVEYARVGLCVLSNPDETIEAPCQTYCGAQEAAACPNSAPAAECTYGCQLTSALVPACSADWKVFIDCAQTSEVTCSDEGDAVPIDCISEYLDYLSCFVDAGQ
jgi:hypothetical protein